MRLTTCLAVCLAFLMGCGPNADEGVAVGVQTSPTPVGWRVEPTATPQARATRPAVAPPPPPHVQPDVRPAPPPTPTGGLPLAALPPPTPLPALACQFDGRTVTVAAPGAEPASHAGTSGLLTLASGEVLPGVFVDLRLSATAFVAGAVIRPETRVRNTTTAPVTVAPIFSVNGGGAEITGDPRSFPIYIRHSMPAASPGTLVPPGETGSMLALVQLPFAAQRDAQFQADVGISSGQFVRVQAALPLQLTAPTAAQELRLDVRADQQQWCLRATDARGGTPTGPLFIALQGRSARQDMYIDPRPDRPDGPQAIWAGGGLSGSPGETESVAWSAWVGGEHYVTAHIGY